MNNKEFMFILKQGEGQFVEFKESVDKSLASEIVAFANASGGKIFIGIRDDGTLKGININNFLKSQIQDIARNCDPSIILNMQSFQNVLIIDVLEGQNKPYSCSAGFYMRMNANSQKMKRDEILRLAIKGGRIRFDEQICTSFNWNDFDEEKFAYYLKLANISNSLSKEEILKNLHVLTDEGFTNAGVLFFAKNPYKYIMTSKIRLVHFLDDKRVEILDKKEVDRGIIGNIEFAINYVKELVSVRFEIKKLAREEHPEYPEEAYREAIVNAIIHFDYFTGSNIAIEKLKSSIVINNKGELLFDQKFFGKKSELRNRLLADLLSRTSFMERVGTGIKRIEDVCNKNKNLVEFNISDSFFVEIHSNLSTSENTSEKTSENTSENIIKLIKMMKGISAKQIANEIGITQRAVEMQISKLKKEGIIKRVGPPKTGYFEVNT
jgi:ATP-dependent DNA helicase RecG